jgi:hypothetical protein
LAAGAASASAGAEEERCDERETQIQGVEAEILAHRFADAEEGVLAGEDILVFVCHRSVFPLGGGGEAAPAHD